MKSKHQKFSYSEILNITDNFKTIIGEGGFGKVYFETLQDQTQVAVRGCHHHQCKVLMNFN